MKTISKIMGGIMLLLLPFNLFAGELSIAQIDSIANVRSSAISAYRKGETQLAVNLYRQCIAMGDSSIIPFYNLACCYGRLNNYDSCYAALKTAVDRGYPDYMELGTDADLNILQQNKEAFVALWQKTFANSYGKVLAKLFDPMVKQCIIKKDTAQLRMMLPGYKRTDAVTKDLASTLDDAGSLLAFSNISTESKLTDIAQLQNRQLKYTDNHFVFHYEYAYPLPIAHFDADFAQLIAQSSLHMRLHTVDHLYSYLDTLFLETPLLKNPDTKVLPQLTDSVMVLTLKSKGEHIDDYQEKISSQGKLCQRVLNMISQSTPISEQEFTALNPKSGDLRFVRINNLPVRKEFSGIKLAFYAGSKVAVVVVDGEYFFVKGKFAL